MEFANTEGKDTIKPHPKASIFRQFIYRLVDTKIFGAMILCIILLNTAILIIETSEEISVKGGWYFSVLDNVFLAIYIMELILKLYALGWLYFKSGWNIMDFIIVVCTTADFLLPLIMSSFGSFDIAAIFRLLKMFKAIKALRALRVLRTIRFLKNLQVIMTTVLQSFRALSTIVMLQGLFLYMFAVIGRGLFYKVAANRFGTVGRAFFTLFQLITLDDWYYMYNDVVIVNPNYSFIIIYLVVYIVLENFIFLNLFVAVLVDNFQRTLTASETNKKDKPKHRTVFAQIDEKIDSASQTSADIVEEKFVHDYGSETSSDVHEPIIEDYYSMDRVPHKRDRQLLSDYFSLLSTMEYNMQQMHVQQKLLDDLVDVAMNIPDVPEEVVMT